MVKFTFPLKFNERISTAFSLVSSLFLPLKTNKDVINKKKDLENISNHFVKLNL